MNRKLGLTLIVVAVMALVACSPPAAAPTPTATPRPTDDPALSVPTTLPTATVPAATNTPAPTPTAGPIGPSGFPADVNPLTGLTVDPANLQRRPLLIKVSNYPEVVRPQTGLMEADHVWEHEVEGFNITRLTAVFWSNTPDYVGSVRSGRPPDLELVPMYQGLFIASGFSTNRQAGGPPRMAELMRAAAWFDRNFSPDFGYGDPYSVRVPQNGKAVEHTLYAVPRELWNLATQKNVNQPVKIEGLMFDKNVPAGGVATNELTIDYPGAVGPVVNWRYDAAVGRWLRSHDGKPHMQGAPNSDPNTHVQLAFDNVVLVYAQHSQTGFIEDEAAQLEAVQMQLQGEGKAILLRDGQRYELRWRRANADAMMQFVDAAGNVIAFKPGTTWFNLVDVENAFFPAGITFLP